MAGDDRLLPVEGEPKDGLARVLGPGDAAAILISNMVGVGILTLPGIVAHALGDARLALLVWAVGGALSLAGALIQAELGCRFPHAGGDYVFLREAYGPFAAFLGGWAVLAVGFPGAIAMALITAAANLAAAAGLDPQSSLRSILPYLILFILSAVHSAGLRLGKRVQNVLTGLEVVALLGLSIGAALVLPAATAPTGTAPAAGSAGAGEVVEAVMQVLFAYMGWNAAAYMAGEVRDPRRSLPRALAGGVLLVTALYLAVNGAYFRLVPAERMAEGIDAGGEMARQLLGPSGGRAVSILLSFVCLGSASAITIVGPRIHYAMARDGVLPGALGRLGSSSHAPVRALWVQSIWTALLVSWGKPEAILSRTIFAILPFAALSAAAVFVFRRRDRRTGRSAPFETPGYPFTPLAFIAVALLVASVYAVRKPADAGLGSLIVLSGAPLYLLGRLRRR